MRTLDDSSLDHERAESRMIQNEHGTFASFLRTVRGVDVAVRMVVPARSSLHLGLRLRIRMGLRSSGGNLMLLFATKI